VSVINDMLNDLERRQSKQQLPVGELTTAGLIAAAEVPARSLKGWMLAPPLAVGLLLLSLWTFGTQQQIPPSAANVIRLQIPPQKVVSAVPGLPETVKEQEPVVTAPPAIRPDTGHTTLADEKAAMSSVAEESGAEPALAGKPEALALRSEPENKPNNQATQPPQLAKKTPDLYRLASRAWRRGESRQAVIHLSSLLQRDPGLLKPSLLLARIYLDGNQGAKMEPVLRRALERYPNQPELTLYLARSLLAQQRLQEAADSLARAMQEDNAEHLGLLAALRQRQGLHGQASELYRRALKQKPNQANWYSGLAISLEHLGMTTAALDAYRRSLQSPQLHAGLRDFVESRLQQLGYGS
jgi:Tfp pilus assembly protein PilF